MQLYIDSNRGDKLGYLYSIGENKSLNTYDLTEKKLLSST
jgi:hypothetical protein